MADFNGQNGPISAPLGIASAFAQFAKGYMERSDQLKAQELAAQKQQAEQISEGYKNSLIQAETEAKKAEVEGHPISETEKSIFDVGGLKYGDKITNKEAELGSKYVDTLNQTQAGYDRAKLAQQTALKAQQGMEDRLNKTIAAEGKRQDKALASSEKIAQSRITAEEKQREIQNDNQSKVRFGQAVSKSSEEYQNMTKDIRTKQLAVNNLMAASKDPEVFKSTWGQESSKLVGDTRVTDKEKKWMDDAGLSYVGSWGQTLRNMFSSDFSPESMAPKIRLLQIYKKSINDEANQLLVNHVARKAEQINLLDTTGGKYNISPTQLYYKHGGDLNSVLLRDQNGKIAPVNKAVYLKNKAQLDKEGVVPLILIPGEL